MATVAHDVGRRAQPPGHLGAAVERPAQHQRHAIVVHGMKVEQEVGALDIGPHDLGPLGLARGRRLVEPAPGAIEVLVDHARLEWVLGIEALIGLEIVEREDQRALARLEPAAEQLVDHDRARHLVAVRQCRHHHRRTGLAALLNMDVGRVALLPSPDVGEGVLDRRIIGHGHSTSGTALIARFRVDARLQASRYQFGRSQVLLSQPVSSTTSLLLAAGDAEAGHHRDHDDVVDRKLVQLDQQGGALDRIELDLGRLVGVVVFLVLPARDVAALPLVVLARRLPRAELAQEDLGIGLACCCCTSAGRSRTWCRCPDWRRRTRRTPTPSPTSARCRCRPSGRPA